MPVGVQEVDEWYVSPLGEPGCHVVQPMSLMLASIYRLCDVLVVCSFEQCGKTCEAPAISCAAAGPAPLGGGGHPAAQVVLLH